jgi:hypothetical protein
VLRSRREAVGAESDTPACLPTLHSTDVAGVVITPDLSSREWQRDCFVMDVKPSDRAVVHGDTAKVNAASGGQGQRHTAKMAPLIG